MRKGYGLVIHLLVLVFLVSIDIKVAVNQVIAQEVVFVLKHMLLVIFYLSEREPGKYLLECLAPLF